ncbi:MAG: Cysteine synthase [Alphaproteobacteria bacterium MarineAlpha5_Bin12]|nr:MAG: Cysteine synthase [Alphaproteobacteria bacterium MarineAlpha5_Bin12]|tara:strand:- start:5479 stop:6933 length:1455 start_codon:yes stop_codon:yes gene_type:complete
MNSNKRIIHKNVKFFSEKNIILPKIKELADPLSISNDIQNKLNSIDKDSQNSLNLYRVHWHNKKDHSKFVKCPEYIILPNELTGVEAKIIINIGRLFPLIQAHKVLAAYGCLVPRIVSGNFDCSENIAIWPSTGNYCRGGVAISKILGCRSVAVLPEGMSKERFEWLEKWVSNSNDIIRTKGTESNVKEIYDKCNELDKDLNNIIINQFNEYNNYSIHRAVTGPSFEKSFFDAKGNSNLKPRFYVSASGSSGTLAAGDYLKNSLGTQTAVVEALECPTLLKNGFGEHNIQGIGDKHVPLIHNAMNTDFVVDVSDKATDNLNLLFNTPLGKEYLVKNIGLSTSLVSRLPEFGFSSIANILASIKLAKFMNLGKDEAIITVATDGADLYLSELERTKNNYEGVFDKNSCSNIFKKYIKDIDIDNMVKLSENEKERVFNLGYYTWVEQQNISLEHFEMRKNQKFWDKQLDYFVSIDKEIDEFNNMII